MRGENNEYVSELVLRNLIRANEHGRVISRESATLDFKQQLNWTDKALRMKLVKVVASFANHRGGYIIYGVKDSPRDIIGIDEEFGEIDDADIASFLNNYMSPAIHFERAQFKLKRHLLGAIYVHPSEHKPVVCIKSYGDPQSKLTEGDIYFRYSSNSDKIKSGDLIHLMNEVREKESLKWIELFKRVSKIGINEAGIFNLGSGEISTHKGNRFVLDEKLLSKLQILDKYSIEEKHGAPAVRIVGEIDKAGTVIQQSKYLHDNDIVADYLGQQVVQEPKEYLRAMCYLSSGTMPVYYFLRQAGFSLEEGKSFLSKVNKNSSAKTKLINRLANDDNIVNAFNSCSINAETAIGQVRKQYHAQIMAGQEISVNNEGEAKRFLEAILNLRSNQFDKDYLYPQVLKIINTYYGKRQLADLLRKAVAYLDLIENREYQQLEEENEEAYVGV